MRIEDGTGTGVQAKVDANHHLHVDAQVKTAEMGASIIGDAYMISSIGLAAADTMTLGTLDEGVVLFIRNDSSMLRFIVEQILIGSDIAGVIAKYVRNDVIGTIGANEVLTPVNLDFSSNKVAVLTAHVWDETAGGITGLSGGVELNVIPLIAGTFVDQVSGVIQLGQNSSLGIKLENPTGGAAEVVANIRGYFDTTEV